MPNPKKPVKKKAVDINRQLMNTVKNSERGEYAANYDMKKARTPGLLDTASGIAIGQRLLGKMPKGSIGQRINSKQRLAKDIRTQSKAARKVTAKNKKK